MLVLGHKRLTSTPTFFCHCLGSWRGPVGAVCLRAVLNACSLVLALSVFVSYEEWEGTCLAAWTWAGHPEPIFCLHILASLCLHTRYCDNWSGFLNLTYWGLCFHWAPITKRFAYISWVSSCTYTPLLALSPNRLDKAWWELSKHCNTAVTLKCGARNR